MCFFVDVSRDVVEDPGVDEVLLSVESKIEGDKGEV